MPLQRIFFRTNKKVLLLLLLLVLGFELPLLASQSIQNFNSHIQTFQILAQTLDNRKAEAEKFLQQGIHQVQNHQLEAAVQSFQQAIKIYQTLGDRQGEASSLNALSVTYYAFGLYHEAIEVSQQALAIYRAIGERYNEADSLSLLGNAYYSLDQYKKSIEFYQQCLAIYRAIGNRQREGSALEYLGRALFHSGSLVEAERTLRSALTILESTPSETSKDSITDDLSKIAQYDINPFAYRALQQVLVAQNKYLDALTIAERYKGRVLEEMLASRLAKTPMLSQEPTLKFIQQVARTHQATLVDYSIIYDDRLPIGWTAPELKLFIWVIQPTGEVKFRQVDLKNLQQQQKNFPKRAPYRIIDLPTIDTPSIEGLNGLIASARQSIGVRGRGSIEVIPIDSVTQTQSLQKLYKLLIHPIHDLLPTDSNARVIFIPQGYSFYKESLFLVPFPALQAPNGKYLVEQHTILTAPSIRSLYLTKLLSAQIRQQQQHLVLKDTLVVGNPKMPSIPPREGEQPQPLPNLPGSEEEARVVSQLLHTKPLIGKQATKATVIERMASSRLIHLATHGLLDFNLKKELPGAIALSPSNTDSGLLTSREIISLKLNAELVVLSACNTGQGISTSDGVIGLARSFIAAGTPSVIVSLWDVPDAPTAELMTEFYRNWLERKLDKAGALRQAMLTIMKQHPNPKDWAAFTLIGDAQ